MFTVILAENSQGKTTLLQAIALVAAGIVGANKLVDSAQAFSDRRLLVARPGRHEELCRIRAWFDLASVRQKQRIHPHAPSDDPSPRTAYSEVFAKSQWKQFAGQSDYGSAQSANTNVIDEVRSQDLSLWFVAAYGPSRRIPSAQNPVEISHRSIDRLRPLFDLNRPLIATGFVDVLARQFGPNAARMYAATLRNVLVGGDGCPGIIPKDNSAAIITDIELRGQGGVRNSADLTEAERVVFDLGGSPVKLPAIWLSSGYQSTIAWIADLIGQVWLEAGAGSNGFPSPHEMEGLVLIDEIDLHLHPRWQMTLIPTLRATFPKIQFIATTHSPLVLCGLKPGEIMLLRADEKGNIQSEISDEDPRLLTASQLNREFFGIENLLPSELGRKIRRHGLLAGIAIRTDAEQFELEQLTAELRTLGVTIDESVPRIQGDAAE